jgi:recombinational DNA repair ATPase RecF
MRSKLGNVTSGLEFQSLNLEFGPRVNLLTGANGSGKSSVLQAIVIALGRATFTLRMIFLSRDKISAASTKR